MSLVLVVDDSLTDRRLAGGLLARSETLTVEYATDGKDALEQIELHVPDVILTDLNMPEVNGLELVKLVREQYPLVPVILMTAQGSEAIAVEALRTGAASYVAKQRLASDLIETVEQVLLAARADRTRARLLRRLRSQRVEFAIENDQDLITSLVHYLQDAIAGIGLCHEADRIRIGVALQEALVNACYHGNLEVSSALRETDHRAYYGLAKERAAQAPYRDRRILVAAEFAENLATFVITDEGPGFDPTTLPDPRDPANLERPSGRGLLLMRTFMDEVTYNSTGNQVTLKKARRANPEKGGPT